MKKKIKKSDSKEIKVSISDHMIGKYIEKNCLGYQRIAEEIKK